MANGSQQFQLSATQFQQVDPQQSYQQCWAQAETMSGNEISYSHPNADVTLQKIESVITAVDWVIKQKAVIDLMAVLAAAPDAIKNALSAAVSTASKSAGTAATSLIESGGAARPGATRPFTDPWGLQGEISATAKTTRSLTTAITADVGESEAYKAALRAGEIGLQRPFGANVGGSDFITAKVAPNGVAEIIVTDVKTSVRGKFPTAKTTMPGSWQTEVQNAIARLKLNDPKLAQQIQDAYNAGRIRLRQVNVNYSPSGQGAISGL